MEIEPDATDWALAVAGDGEAFGRLFDRHRDRVFRHSLRLVSSAADVDDIVAISFLEAWRKRESVRLVRGSVLPWLLTTATNVAANIRRGQRRYRALLAKVPPAEHSQDHSEYFDDGTAQSAMRSLSLADRQVLTMCVLEGFTELEAAAALGVPVGTVKSRLARARARLASKVNGPQQYLKEEPTHGA